MQKNYRQYHNDHKNYNNLNVSQRNRISQEIFAKSSYVNWSISKWTIAGLLVMVKNVMDFYYYYFFLLLE